jgi:hypothetical protein
MGTSEDRLLEILNQVIETGDFTRLKRYQEEQFEENLEKKFHQYLSD